MDAELAQADGLRSAHAGDSGDGRVEQVFILRSGRRARRGWLALGPLRAEDGRLRQWCRERPGILTLGRWGGSASRTGAKRWGGAARRCGGGGCRRTWHGRGVRRGLRLDGVEQGKGGADLGGTLHRVKGVVAIEEVGDGLLQGSACGALILQ